MRHLTRRASPVASPRKRSWLRSFLRAAALTSVLGGAATGTWWYQMNPERVLELAGELAALESRLVALESESRENINRLGVDLGLVVSRVAVAGRVNTPKKALSDALGLDIGAPILAVRPDALRERIEALGWVARATVERHFPDTIRVTLVERTPVALWWNEDRKLLIDIKGAVIGLDTEGHWSHLKPVIGANAPAHFGELVAILAVHPRIESRIAAVIRTGGRRWTLNLDNGIDVHLPEQGVASALARLAHYATERWLFDRDIIVVDMRLEDRIAVRPLRPPKRLRGPGI